jgi:DNA repair exonuclease SbcCD nuclease subunit
MDTPIGRLDNIVETQFKKLRFILQWAKNHNSIILQAGDFFDKPRSWFLLPMVISLLKEYEVPIYCVFGQHDTFFYNEETRSNTNLGVLEKAGLVTILNDMPECFDNGLRLYGASYGQEIPQVQRNDEFNVLVIHGPICNEQVPGTEIDAKGFLALHSKYNIILAGDIHRKFQVWDKDRCLINTGPMLRRECTVYNMEHKPGFYYLENEKLKWIEIPHEVANKTLTRDHLIQEENKNSLLQEFIEKIGTESDGDSVSFQEVLQGLVKEGSVSKRVQTIISEVMSNV